MAAEHDERTPLLNGNGSINGTGNGNPGTNGEANGNSNGNGHDSHDFAKEERTSWFVRLFGTPNTVKILTAGFIISFSFSLTQGLFKFYCPL